MVLVRKWVGNYNLLLGSCYKIDTENNKYCRVTDTGVRFIFPYNEEKNLIIHYKGV